MFDIFVVGVMSFVLFNGVVFIMFINFCWNVMDNKFDYVVVG